MKKILTLKLVLILSLVSIFMLPSFSNASIKASIEKLDKLDKTSVDNDVDDKFLKAVGIIDGMGSTKMWAEVGNLVNREEFTYSRYYDELLYLYMAHLANQESKKQVEVLWNKMRNMKNSVHLFPAMLIRLFSQDGTQNYNKELSRLFEYIGMVSSSTPVHGPMIEGNFLFGYKVKEDYSFGQLPQVFTLLQYKESPEVLNGFSDDTSYVGLLESYLERNGFSPWHTLQLAVLYEKGNEKEQASTKYYKLANYYKNQRDYHKAKEYITKALDMTPFKRDVKQLGKEIDLALVLNSEEGDESREATPQAEMSNLACDDNYLMNHNVRLTKGALRDMSAKELRLMRNEIFARYGRPFRSQDLHEYFTKKCWYKINVDYNDSVLNETDRHNILVIQSVEDK